MADSAFVDFDLGLIYPQTLAGMSCERVDNYDNKALGYSVFYRHGTGFTAEVSVYTLGHDSIGSGPTADGINLVFERIEADQKRLKDEGNLVSVQKRGSMVVPKKGAIQFANTVYKCAVLREVNDKIKPIPQIQSVYVTGSRKHFVCVQFRFDVAKNKEARSMADLLVRQMVSLLGAEASSEEQLLAACDAVVHNPADYSGMVAAQHVLSTAQLMAGLNVYSDFFVWAQDYRKPKNADLLTAAYFAGMLKVVLPEKLESGGEQEAFVSMLKAYDAMRRRDQIVAIAKLDEWSKAEDKAALYQEVLVEFGYARAE